MEVLNKLVDKGNTVLIIEHNLDVVKQADYIIDVGPEGGKGGGKIVAEGTLQDIVNSKKSITGQYLAKELSND
jgi:excinuclease ABC subunit A